MKYDWYVWEKLNDKVPKNPTLLLEKAIDCRYVENNRKVPKKEECV